MLNLPIFFIIQLYGSNKPTYKSFTFSAIKNAIRTKIATDYFISVVFDNEYYRIRGEKEIIVALYNNI